MERIILTTTERQDFYCPATGTAIVRREDSFLTPSAATIFLRNAESDGNFHFLHEEFEPLVGQAKKKQATERNVEKEEDFFAAFDQILENQIKNLLIFRIYGPWEEGRWWEIAINYPEF